MKKDKDSSACATRPISLLKFVAQVLVLVSLAGCQNGYRSPSVTPDDDNQSDSLKRRVVNNMLNSPSLPQVAIQVHEPFNFAGSFDIEILANAEWPDSLLGKAIAAGERFVFVDADSDSLVNKLLIVQFEGFLDNNEQTYNYNFASAETMGENKYRHNTWFYNSSEQAIQNPNGEGAKTRAFLTGLGYQLEDEFMMSRWVGLASQDRRNEIIIYYIEMLRSSTGVTLTEWESQSLDDRRQDILSEFVARSRRAFKIASG